MPSMRPRQQCDPLVHGEEEARTDTQREQQIAHVISRFQDGEKTLLNPSTPLLISALLPAFTVNHDVSLCSDPQARVHCSPELWNYCDAGRGPRHRKKHAFLLIFPSPGRPDFRPTTK